MLRTKRRGYIGAFAVMAAMTLMCVLATNSAAAAENTIRVSVASSGNQANGSSAVPSFSDDGRYVTFTSQATNLVPGDTNGSNDVFVRDRTLGTTERVSVDSSGNQANNQSGRAYISSDGRYVVFYSQASNLVANDTNGSFDVFVRDRTLGTTERVSVSSSGNQATGYSLDPYISSNGRYVVFRSGATNLVAGDTNGQDDVFVRDRTLGTTERVSADSSGNQATGGSSNPSISDDGNLVAFDSAATNLVTADTNGVQDVFVRDRTLGATRRVSVDSLGNQANGQSFLPSISENGQYVLFNSGASNLVPDDTNYPNGANEAFVHDLQTGQTERVSVGNSGNQANGDSTGSDISSGGRYVAFSSYASNLVSSDTNGTYDVFVRDRQTGTTERVSVDRCGNQANDHSDLFGSASISDDGNLVAFPSQATNLVTADTNGVQDVFMHERDTRTTAQPNDCIAPSTSHTASPLPYANGWNNTDVTVTFNAQDDEGGSGVKEIRYSATGAQSISEAVYDPQNPPVIYTEGTTSISYFSTDNAGNQESPAKTLTVKLDKSVPSAPVISSPANNSFDTDGTITLSGTGEANATIEVFEATASGDISKGTTPVDASGTWTKILSGVSNGSHSYKAKATDAAGNTSGFSNARAIIVDKVKPKVSTATPTGTGVARGTNATATFSERMDPTTITTSTFKLFRCSSTTSTNCATQITNVTISRSMDRLKATLNPYGTSSTLLAGRTKYKVVVTTGAKDEAGNQLDQDVSMSGNQPRVWYFTT